MSDLDAMPDLDFGAGTLEDVPVDENAPKRTRRPRSDKGQPRGPRAASSRDKKLADDLLGPWGLVIKALAMPMPTVAAVMAQRADKSTQAIVSLASPKLKDKLAKVSKIGPGSDLIETVAMMFVAAMLDIGKLEPGSPLAMFTGVQELFDLTHEKVEVNVPDNVSQFPTNASPFGSPFPGA